MKLTLIEPRKALSKAFLKKKPLRNEIEVFKTNLLTLLSKISVIENRPKDESEEHLKNDLRDFLRDTYYRDTNAINTKDKKDLVIHLNKSTDSEVGVIIEAKRPTNVGEMINGKDFNKKALHELILYYLHERNEVGNFQLKQLVITNINEWYIIDANHFDKYIYNNAKIRNLYKTKVGDNKKNPHFYEEIEKIVSNINVEIPCVYFNIQDYKAFLDNENKEDDKELIALYKILSPEHMLKLSFANDSNSLDKNFYSELLHIIGLTEIKEGGKKLIQRHKLGNRYSGSLIENTIEQLESLDKLSRLQNARQFGETKEERLSNLAMELTITWVNRILFLKLLEAQLISYHKGDKSYSFLNSDLIKDYDNLNSLFFQVLAKKPNERNDRVKKEFEKVPYLNSSLFEPTDLEHQTLFVSQLEDNVTLPLLSNTVIKNSLGNKQIGIKNPLAYFLSFLDAYDFASEGTEDIQEENKTLINASVLGLIFEKINGYKDGSFFTPSFITMYMCKETIRRAVVQKFKEQEDDTIETFKDLKAYCHRSYKPENIKHFNSIVNSLRICDPAVGSGHFLVSALNELISIKKDLGILGDKDGIPLRVDIQIENDELHISGVRGKLFEYTPNDPESQAIQETLFHEKQTIIENCLFGVDINPNSVKICRLRLWIELLKNAYYRPDTNELETLPNIDINIKCGNSLISRFELDADLKEALKKSKLTIDAYKNAVNTYRNAESKEQKREMEELIGEIKTNFRSEINANGKEIKELIKDQNEYYTKYESAQLFEATLNKAQVNNKKELAEKIKKKENAIEEIKSNKIYENAFEWRFEFPDILNDEGDFVGFDAMIGNPPYIGLEEFDEVTKQVFRTKYNLVERKYETSVLFIILGLSLVKKNSLLCYIAPVTWQTGENYSKLREKLFSDWGLKTIINLPFNIFTDAYVDTCIYLMSKSPSSNYDIYSYKKTENHNELKNIVFKNIETALVSAPKFKIILNPAVFKILNRLDSNNFNTLENISISTQGLSPSAFLQSNETDEKFSFPFLKEGNAYNYCLNVIETYSTSLRKMESLIPFYDKKEKILIRRIINRQDRLTVGFTDEKIVFKKDINPFIITDNNFQTKYVLAILASKFISYLYINISAIALKDDFRQTTLTELRELLIPKISIDEQNKFIEKVDQILLLKKENSQNDTNALEQEIDAMVYELYGLSKEEMEIVEGREINTHETNLISI
ncbi:type IIG restriction enzyme/methyltransferase [Flavobacterium taihuense]|uniref:site-specific DNA-methyltransferase (adenine-specific) n=1 Tax=Flavobacterium taihuense TaxID=2857508 RepID=A0ABS6Y1H9_9FLAO|nr:DNA methyltransferase [Flavobacterium taihuense]MBW4362732.1 N-6 DNA methylase [Flavobacterium taihuense]